MKEYEMLAADYVHGNLCQVSDTYKDHYDTFNAGFLMARTLAISLMSEAAKMAPIHCSSQFDHSFGNLIRSLQCLGEKEV